MHWLCTTLLVLSVRADGDDGSRLQAAERTLADHHIDVSASGLLEFFRRRTLDQAQRDSLAGKIRQLGSNSYRVRARAAADLVAAGGVARPLLNDALKHEHANLEIVRRAELCLAQLDDGPESSLVRSAALLLGHRRPGGAAAALLSYLPQSDNAAVTEEIQEALVSLAVRDGRPEPALVQALTSGHAAQRGSAGAALIRAGARDQVPAVGALLHDAKPQVRLQMAGALLQVRDKSALPVLVDLLAVLPPQQVWQAEEWLTMVAGDEAPPIPAGTTQSPQQLARIWGAWWREREASFEPADLESRQRLRGLTLITQMDAKGVSGRVYEIHADQKLAWEITGLRHPVDAQVLGKDRVLIAEYLNRRVTERDFQGRVVWEKEVHMPIACQRLPDGRTFIASRRQLMIVDRDGKESFLHHHAGPSISAARRLRDGQFVLVTSGGLLERRDSDGRLLKSFPVGPVYSLGANIDVLPGGRVLVPQYRDSKVVEYDADGHRLWDIRVSFPTSATRLPNGHVLVVSMLRQQVTELTRDGREVWSYRTDGRPWRARKR